MWALRIDLIGLIKLIDLIDLIGRIDLIDHLGLINLRDLIDLLDLTTKRAYEMIKETLIGVYQRNHIYVYYIILYYTI